MEWVKIFSSQSELQKHLEENRPRLLQVYGKKICLVYRESKLFAVQDSCPHNGESLSKGTVNFQGEIVCPWHGQRFSLKTGREGGQQSQDLITYPVKETEEGVFIGV
ncbi:MAG TPA: Rieske (2Fe-2S) protein [Cyclobacteriaceae bacterium]|jgi:nitrite reductase/ring-hydroxylating ferredoxin subunit|nr:Rieske (2Fe-2S) protein [Cyclobacteriaceae bacterium]